MESGQRRYPWELDAYGFGAVIACSLCSFVTTLVVTILSTILNRISQDLSVTYSQSICLSEAVSISTVAFSLVTIHICDRYGNKFTTILGMSIFTVSLVFSAISIDFCTMFFSRMLSGIGIAFVLSSSYSMISHIVEKVYLAEVTAVNYAASSLGGLLGPFIGLFLSEAIGWRAMMLALVPISVLCTLSLAKARNHRSQPGLRLDVPSHLAFAAATSLFLFAVMAPSPATPFLLIAAALLTLILFIFRKRAEYKMFNTALLRNRAFIMAIAIGFFFIAANYMIDNGISYCIMLSGDVVVIMGVTVSMAFLASILRALKPAIQMVFSPMISRMLRGKDHHAATVYGFIMMISAIAMLASVFIFDSALWYVAMLFFAIALISFASSVFRPINKSLMIASVESCDRNAASSIYTLVDNMGKITGTIMIINMLDGAPSTPETAFECLAYVIVSVAFLSFIGVSLCIRRHRGSRADH